QWVVRGAEYLTGAALRAEVVPVHDEIHGGCVADDDVELVRVGELLRLARLQDVPEQLLAGRVGDAEPAGRLARDDAQINRLGRGHCRGRGSDRRGVLDRRDLRLRVARSRSASTRRGVRGPAGTARP